jgi:hypothetical protein
VKHYPRLDLATQIAQSLRGTTLFGDAPNGLFLAAPRRTGKSTFLQRDLTPECERQGAVVVYVDLWADKNRDPAHLLAEAISKAVDSHLGRLRKAAKASGLESLGLAGWLKVDLARIGKPDGTTLTDALTLLRDVAQKPIVLIVDEAQHALTSMAGEAAMAALKAARDRLNTPEHINLMLVMSGSDRDKLLRLVNTSGAAFYGSQVQRMPALGKDFVDFVVSVITASRPDLKPIDSPLLAQAFELFGARPQFFSSALGEALNPLTTGSGRFEAQVAAAAQQKLLDDEAQMASEYLSLKPLERAVLWRLLEQGNRFRPYDAEALRFYRQASGQAKVSAQNAQAALESLRARSPALAWKSARGEYVADDTLMNSWYAAQVAAAAWPPQVRAA